MKTRSAPVEAPNIAAIVKARHHARVLCPISESIAVGQQSFPISCGSLDGADTGSLNSAGAPGLLLGIPTTCDEPRTGAEEKRSRTDSTRPVWSPDERRLFFQAVRLYGRNFTEIARFIRSRGHRIFVDWTAGLNAGTITDHSGSVTTPGLASVCSTTPNPASVSVAGPSGANSSAASLHPTTACSNISDLNAPCGGPTREQVRFFYQRTWQKIRRYVKFPEEVPQHAREVYALVNYSVLRTRIKKPLDHRLGEKLNELVHCGTTVIRHNGCRFLLRTPVCQALKQLNHVAAPNHEFLLPEDIWIELVPSTQSDLWRVIEAEQNPRLRLRVDINRQLSDVIGLVENKWQLAAERLQTLFGLPNQRECKPPRLLLRITPTQTIDGAIRLQEVARIRSGDMALRAYLERIRARKSDTVPPNPSSLSVQTTGLSIATDSSSGEPPNTWSTDFPKIVKEVPLDCFSLLAGLMAARGIKLLTIFLALGCPDRIRFEYSFVMTDERNPPSASKMSGHPADQTNLYICPPNDADGQGISNGLRRLLHLNASDYLLHREWAKADMKWNSSFLIYVVSASSVTNTSPASSSKPCTSVAISAPVSSPSVATTLTISSSVSTAATNTFITSVPVQSGVPNKPVHPFLTPITALPTSVLRSTNEAVQLVVADAFSVANSKSVTTTVPTSDTADAVTLTAATAINATNLQTSTVSSSNRTTPIISAVQGSSPNLIMLPKTANSKVAVVERRLDIPQSSLGSQNRAPVISKPPLPALPPLQRAVHLPTVTIPNTPLSRLIALQPRPSQPMISTPITNTATESKQSSLSAVKAFNSKRRRTSSARGPRRAGGTVGSDVTAVSSDSASKSPCSFSAPLSTAFQSSISGSAQLPVGLPLLFPAPGNANKTTSAVTTVTSAAAATTRSGVLSANTAFIQGFSSLTPTVSVLNASSLLFGDGDTTLGTLLDPSGSNQSTISAMSQDTLASLLNTICHSAAVPVVDSGSGGQSQTQTSTGTSDSSTRRVDRVGTSETVACKCEDPTELRTDWNDISRLDFHGVGRFYPSSSTPHLPPASPAFADISLTDSMAAAVMDTHEGDLEVDDYEEGQVPSFPVVYHPGLSSNKEFLEANGSSSSSAMVSFSFE
ncbi:Protein cramped [Fasciola gigantica]|uniref:Protein cramped n=1 Tax=Fasciola gigantica TaxID=46835 RepID=A0A504YAV2_FASGI|nr:Protein cramped [Fasciola gigantica]